MYHDHYTSSYSYHLLHFNLTELQDAYKKKSNQRRVLNFSGVLEEPKHEETADELRIKVRAIYI